MKETIFRPQVGVYYLVVETTESGHEPEHIFVLGDKYGNLMKDDFSIMEASKCTCLKTFSKEEAKAYKKNILEKQGRDLTRDQKIFYNN